MAAINERDIERYLVGVVVAHGGEVRKVQWIGRSGAPDRFVMLPDRIGKITYGGVNGMMPEVKSIYTPQSFWVELKAPGKVPTAVQLREHERMRKMGQRVLVIDSFEKVDALFL